MNKLGASLLQDLLSLDRGHHGQRIDCGAGHQAKFVDYRDKTIDTVLGPVVLNRAYYHCADCKDGVLPKDAELGVAGVSLSPGLRKMTDRVAVAAPFVKGAGLLAELAGVRLSPRRVERCAEADGRALAELIDREAAAVRAGACSPLGPAIPPVTLYVAADGTGVPCRPTETVGRRGKSADGTAHTREVKLGVCFTQTEVDTEGFPVRDAGSSSYVATFEPAGHFGDLLYAEARRRGSDRAGGLVMLGDGAPWIWNLASEYFPAAIQIVDLFHAREHLHELGKLLAGSLGDQATVKRWVADRSDQLDAGDVEGLLIAARDIVAPVGLAKDLDTALGYFETNVDRMRYGHFRDAGCFVGSGAVESGCKAVVGARLKQSGMRWTVDHVTGILALRCEEASGRWEQIWRRLDNQTSVA